MAQGHVAAISIGASFVIGHSSFPALNPQLKTLNSALASPESVGWAGGFVDCHSSASIRYFRLWGYREKNCRTIDGCAGGSPATGPHDGRTGRAYAAA